MYDPVLDVMDITRCLSSGKLSSGSFEIRSGSLRSKAPDKVLCVGP